MAVADGWDPAGVPRYANPRPILRDPSANLCRLCIDIMDSAGLDAGPTGARGFLQRLLPAGPTT